VPPKVTKPASVLFTITQSESTRHAIGTATSAAMTESLTGTSTSVWCTPSRKQVYKITYPTGRFTWAWILTGTAFYGSEGR
jgi:hypothetical protein